MSEVEILGSEEINSGHLKAFIERIERAEEELEAIKDDIKDIYAELAGTGFDKKIVKMIIKIRKQDKDKRKEEQEILDLYMSALDIM
jgi:uncharacterized protein (UPF0335 family)